MSDLTELEKRKLLRERRQKKFGNGGGSSRLNKITGKQENTVLNADSPLDSIQNKSREESKVDKSTKEMEELLEKFSPLKEDVPNQKNPEIALFEQLMKIQQNNGISTTESNIDIFSSFVKQNLPQEQFNGKEKELSADGEKTKYHIYQVNRMKAQTIIVKWFILLVYLYYFMKPNFSTFQVLLSQSNFFIVFTSFEIISLSIYYQMVLNKEKLDKIDTQTVNSKILTYISMVPEGLIPISNLQGKVMLLLYYWDVLSLYLTDLCFSLVVMGLMKYYHSV